MLLTCNSANYNNRADWNTLDGHLSTVGSNGKSSYYGTFDQTGNINELLDTISGSYPIIRGGSFNNDETFLSKLWFGTQAIDGKVSNVGFRVAKASSTIDSTNYVLVEDASNSGDSSNNDYGRVNYAYQLKKYPVTNSEYAAFLNSVSKTPNGLGLWDTNMGDLNRRGGINRSLVGGIYVYTVRANMGDKPVNYINWFSAVRYINWLSNNQPVGAPGVGTTEGSVYTLSNSIIQGTNKPSANNKNSYWLPSEDEWYKAAYYDPDKTGSGPGYWAYATQSDSIPDSVVVDSNGTANNTFSNPNICISPTPTPSVTPTITVSPSITQTVTVSVSLTPTLTPSISPTRTVTPTVTTTKTPTPTRTVTRTVTPTPSITSSVTPTITVSISPTRTPTMTRSATPTNTPTASVTLTPSKSLCSSKKLGELIYQSSVYVNDDIQVLHKGFLLQGRLVPNVSILNEPPNVSTTPTRTATPTPTRTMTPTPTRTMTPTPTPSASR